MATLVAATTMARLATNSSASGQCCAEGCVTLWDGVRGRNRRREHRHRSADPPLPREEAPRTPEKSRQGTSSKPCSPPRKPERLRHVPTDPADPEHPPVMESQVGELSETAAELLDEAAGLLVEAASFQMISVNQVSVSKESDGSEPVESMELLSLAFKLEGEALRESKSSRQPFELQDAWSDLVAEAKALDARASASSPKSGRRRMSWAEDSALVHVYQQVEDEYGVAQQNQTEPGTSALTSAMTITIPSPLPTPRSQSSVTSSPASAMRRMTSLRQLSVDGVATQEQSTPPTESAKEQSTPPTESAKVAEQPTIVDGDVDAQSSASLAPAASLKPAVDSRPPPTAGRRGGLRRSAEKGSAAIDRAARDQSRKKCSFDEVQTMAMMDSSNVSVKPGICCLSIFSCTTCFEEAVDNVQ
mmetsp:Transcript_10629/g.20598  ORF Transcript_10629/g.20598 Transcript_10629/m.20598 type:complete len:418 (+) Transcript_10629:47-1300(+)